MKNMKINQQSKTALFLGASFIITASTSNATTLLFNNFDGDDLNDTGPAFQQITNGQGSDESTNLNTGLISSATDSANSAIGFNTGSKVDVTALAPTATGFTIQWVVSGATFTSNDTSSNAAGTVNANGWFFGVTAGTGSGGSDLFNNVGHAFGITLLSENFSPNTIALFESGVGNGSQVSTSLGVASPSAASINDGFTLSLTFNSDSSWSAFTTGLDNNISTSGTADDARYDILGGGLVPNTTVQGLDIDYTIDSVTVTAIPEPSAALMVGLFTMFGATLRRRTCKCG